MSECRFREQVFAYAEGQLAGEERVQFEAHLAGCGDCREEARRARALNNMLGEALGEGEAVDVSGRVEAAIAAKEARLGTPRRRWMRVAGITMAAACVLVAAGLYVLGPDRGEPATRALADGAKWLERTQESDGHWDSKAHGSGFDFDIGLTGLSVIALMEAHDRLRDGKSLEAAVRGAVWLAGRQDQLGRFLQQGDHSGMYGQAVATLAMVRVNERRPDGGLHAGIERALGYGVMAQSVRGGWSYTPGVTSDTSHTGWFVLALARARADGFAVPEEVLGSAMDYVNSMTDASGRVSYDVEGRTSAGLAGTSIAVNAAVARGITRESVVYAVARKVSDTTPDWNDRQQNLYMWFFASRGLNGMGLDGGVRNWQRRLAETLIEHQERTRGKDYGSWSNNDTMQVDAGRVYATSLALVCLSQSR